MKKMLPYIISSLFFFSITGYSQPAVVKGTSVTVSSPDKNFVLQFYQKTAPDNKKTMYYTLAYKGKAVVNESALNIQLDNRLSESAMNIPVDILAGWTSNLLVKKIGTSSKDTSKVGIPDFDLPGIIQYGKERGIGVWLYVNLQGLYAQSDSLFAIYKKWDVKGMKFGFVQAGSHRWTTWLEEMFKKAAENGLMVNVHDEWRPTGEQRTWPNLMTAEGVRGNEEMPGATQNTILPFTRFIAGPADYTFCYFDKRLKTTHAHQLALAAVYYSPIQTLYWYDTPSMYTDEPELEFWDKLPTVWDETKVIQGIPGQFITTARRKGEEWFVGTITNDDARTLKIPFDFLTKGKEYIASIYSDDPAAVSKTKVKVERQPVTASTVLDVPLQAAGGQAIWIREEKYLPPVITLF